MKLRSLAIVLFAVSAQNLLCKALIMDKGDTNTVIMLNKKAWDASFDDPELSKKYAAEALALSNTLNYSKGLSYSYNIYGTYYKVKGNYDSAMFYYRKSLEIRKKIGAPVNIARSYRNIMTMEGLLGNSEKAIETAVQAIKVLDPCTNDPDALIEKASLEVHVAPFYGDKGDFKRAIYLISDAKNIFSKSHNENGLAAASVNLGNIYESQKRYDKAIDEYNMAARIFSRLNNQQDLAAVYNDLGVIYHNLKNDGTSRFYLVKAMKLRQELGFTDEVNGSLLNLGILYEKACKPDSAALYYRMAVDQSLKAGKKKLEFESRWAMGTFLHGQKKYAAAVVQLLIAARLTSGEPITTERIALLKDISKAYDALGKPDSALFFSNRYTAVNDSLNEILRSSIALQSTINEKNSELELKNSELELGREKTKQQTTALIGLSVFILCLLIIFFLYIRFIRSKKSMQQLRELVKDKELKALDAMLEGQQEERKRLATELHDTIGSMLSATKYSFRAMEKSMDKMVEENKNQYQKINSMLDETMDSVRRISHDMAAGTFTEKGIEGALAELCGMFEQPGKIQIHLNVYGFDERLDSNIEKNLYQIVSELLTNIIKHANANDVIIQLLKNSQNINLTVEDNGIGFDPKDIRKNKGIGLSNVEKRVRHLNGKWSIDSGNKHGTTIVVDVPVNDNGG